MASIIDTLLVTADEIIDRATELVIASKGFDLDRQAYHDGYKQLYAVYQDVVEARQKVQREGSSLQPAQVSNRIPGISQGATYTRDALIRSGSSSLLTALIFLETKIATLLTAMHDSYVTYQRTDEESSFNLINKAATP
jgi:hypothetical protein